jgi:helicase MOV-10
LCISIYNTLVGNRGRYEDRIEFLFEDISLNQTFTISRPVRAVVGVSAELDLLRPTAPYEPPKPRAREPDGPMVDGIKPPALAAIKWVIKLPEAMIPEYVRPAIESGIRLEKIRRVERTLLPRNLNNETYARHWRVLLWIEEFQMKYALDPPSLL